MKHLLIASSMMCIALLGGCTGPGDNLSKAVLPVSCAYDSLVKNGFSPGVTNNTMYFCTDTKNASSHIRVRVFENGKFDRQITSQANISYTQVGALDSTGATYQCIYNMDLGGVHKYTVGSIALNGAKELSSFWEMNLVTVYETTWSCMLATPDLAI